MSSRNCQTKIFALKEVAKHYEDTSRLSEYHDYSILPEPCVGNPVGVGSQPGLSGLSLYFHPDALSCEGKDIARTPFPSFFFMRVLPSRILSVLSISGFYSRLRHFVHRYKLALPSKVFILTSRYRRIFSLLMIALIKTLTAHRISLSPLIKILTLQTSNLARLTISYPRRDTQPP